jgi:hypothetical protein
MYKQKPTAKTVERNAKGNKKRKETRLLSRVIILVSRILSMR